MGVDVTVFLGKLHPGMEGEPGQFFRVDAMARLYGGGVPLAERLAGYRGAVPVFFYAPAGNAFPPVTEDAYGSRSMAVPLAALGDYPWPAIGDSHGLDLLRAMIAAAPPWVTHAVVWCS